MKHNSQKTSIKYGKQISYIENSLKTKGWSDGFKLLCEMVARAESDETFKGIFEGWLVSKSTLDIRCAGEGFRGLFKTDLEHFCAVDSLDSCI